MARAIDKDYLLTHKRKVRFFGIGPDDESWGYAVPVEVIENASTIAPPGEWVSVEESLPENSVDVLCWYEYFRYGNFNRMYQTYGIGYCIDGYWGGEVSHGTKCRVLYWMPLPTPPECRPPEGEA